MADLRKLGEVAAGRHGLITRDEMANLGITSAGRRGLLRDGIVLPAGTRAYRLAGAPRTRIQEVLEACMDVDGWAFRRSSAALHQLSDFSLDDPIDVVVRHGRRNARSKLARVHTSTWLPPDDLVVVDGVPTVGVARCLFSLASLVPEIPLDRVADAVDEALRDGKATEGWLWWHLEHVRRRGRNGVAVFEELLTRRAGGEITESWLEREVIRILKEAELPLPECQARVSQQGQFVARVDFLYREQQAVIEVSGYRYHRTKAQTTDDARRRRELTAAGYRVHEFTHDEIVRTPEALVATARSILGLPGPPDPTDPTDPFS